MPIYTYACDSCNKVIEKRQSYTDDPLTTCEHCGNALRRVIHPVGIVFKGSGWYVNDSRPSATPAAKSTDDGKAGEAKASEPSSGEKPQGESGAGSGDAPASNGSTPAPATTPSATPAPAAPTTSSS